MTFDHKALKNAKRLSLLLGLLLFPGGLMAAPDVALVPERTIYPGEKISLEMVRSVDVINPNIGTGYASTFSEVDGMVATRTLLPGRTIPVATLREAWAVERGTRVVLIFADNGLVITAPGTPLQNGAIGDLIRVRNTDSGLIISGTVMNDGSIQVTRK